MSRPASGQRWATRTGLVLAMAGNAVGLGNFLRFPARAAQNGGGALLIPYLISFALMGIPLLWVEWASGVTGAASVVTRPRGMLDRLGPQRWLKYVGVFGLADPRARWSRTRRGCCSCWSSSDARSRCGRRGGSRSGRSHDDDGLGDLGGDVVSNRVLLRAVLPRRAAHASARRRMTAFGVVPRPFRPS